MNGLLAFGLVFILLGFVVAGWLGWQLLRQNGRILLRLDGLEQRLNEIEFGETEPKALPIGSEAPAFELPDLDGQTKSIGQYRGRHVLLIFFNPACGFCREFLRKAENRKQKEEIGDGSASLSVLVVSTGEAEENRDLFKQHFLPFPVLLQTQSEVGAAYLADGTPGGYLISPEGLIVSELAMGVEALLALLESVENRKPKGEMDKTIAAGMSVNGNDRANRFSTRSLTRSKIKRDGLKAGTPAPHFTLPRLDGRGDLSLSDFRGHQVLLVFSSPGCGPCFSLAPELERFHYAQQESKKSPLLRRQDEAASGAQVVMISKGEPKENRLKAKEQGLTFPIVLQQQWEISRRYGIFTTPVAYLISEDGIILEDVAVGIESILKLLARASASSNSSMPNNTAIQGHEDLLRSQC